MHKNSLLLAFVGLLATSSLAAEPIVDIMNVDAFALDKRQQNSQSTDTTPPASSTPPRTSTSLPAPTTSAEPTTRPSNPPPNTSPSRPTSSTPPPPETSDREPTTSPDRPTTTTTQPSSRSTISSIPIVTSRTNIRTTVVTITRDGSAIASEVVSSTVEQETIGSQPTTIPIQSDGGSSNSGLSDSSKKIIAGVVGGVGGAILLGGLALVAWRMWGRKKPETDDYDDIRSGGGSDSLRAEKRQSATPFQSTLDQYHTPAPKPNAAANF